jgi:hypothetical protein
MINFKTLDQNEMVMLSSQQVLPTDTYPQNYIHSVFNHPQDAAEAIQALQTVGYDAQNISFLQSQDYIRAVAQRDPQPEGFFSGLIRMFSTFDHDFEDVYMNEALCGGNILVFRPSRHEQIMQAREILVSHHAHHVKYVGNWTFADLS